MINQHNNSLNDLLNSEQSHSRYRYLLLDMLSGVNELSILSLNALQQQLADDAIVPIARPEISYDLSLCPQLVCLASPNQSVDANYINSSLLLAEQERLFSKRYICGWLVSELPPVEAAEQLLAVGIKMGELQGRAFCPFYEPFRLTLFEMGNAISPNWLGRHLPSFDHYRYLNVDSMALNEVIQQQPSPSPQHGFVADQAIFNLNEYNNIFYLYSEYLDILADDGLTPPPNALWQLSDYYRQAAKSMQLNHLADRYLFAFYSMRYGNLSHNPAVLKAIEQCKTEPGTLGSALNRLDERQWQLTRPAQ